MLRWLGPRRAPEPSNPTGENRLSTVQEGIITDDPLAAFDSSQRHCGPKHIYSVSRINPLFQEHRKTSTLLPQETPKVLPAEVGGEKSNSSGYGGSFGGGSILNALLTENVRLSGDAVTVIEQNPTFVKSIKVTTTQRTRCKKSIHSVASGSSASGSLSTIPEGRVDSSIPKPVWPKEENTFKTDYDSLVDDALLLYTSLNYVPHSSISPYIHDGITEVKRILVELFNNINHAINGGSNISPDDLLKEVNDKIASSIEILKTNTEEEMKTLCNNLKNCRKINSVLRAFNNYSSSSGDSSQSSPAEWNSVKVQDYLSSGNEDVYHSPSGSSSSGSSECLRGNSNNRTKFNDEILNNVLDDFKGFYGTLSKSDNKSVSCQRLSTTSSLKAINDNKPSVWEQYYGVKAVQDEEVGHAVKPTDVPLFPGGRPEADFTLDVPRSDMLHKQMQEDKKWRFRCRLLTAFLSLVFFLLSVMAVSLMLTRGKRMFGSMM